MNYNFFRALLLCLAMIVAATAAAQPKVSDEDTQYWYRITCAMSGADSYAMTDCSHIDDICQLQMLATSETEEKSQWKIIKTESGDTLIVNRATEMMIYPGSINIGMHNATKLTMDIPQNGFSIKKIATSEVFTIQSVEDDGVKRSLAMADRNGDALTWPSKAEMATSSIAWKFTLVEEDIAGIGNCKGAASSIRVANHRVMVSGVKEWQLFNAQGEEMPRTTDLAPGTYLVKMGKENIKVLVN